MILVIAGNTRFESKPLFPQNPTWIIPFALVESDRHSREDCGGAWQFMVQRQEYSVFYTTDRLLEIFSDVLEQGTEAITDYQEEVHTLQKWLTLDHFDRHRANRRLKQYANGDETWLVLADFVERAESHSL